MSKHTENLQIDTQMAYFMSEMPGLPELLYSDTTT